MAAKTVPILAILTIAACGPVTSSVSEPGAGPKQAQFEAVELQEILTPVPVRLRLPSWVGAERVLLHYRTFGEKEWSALELSRAGHAWAGAVPCLEVSTITGNLEYYVSAYGPDDRVVAFTGSKKWPHVVSVRYRLDGGARGLAGAPRPLRCVDPADCPPDFPGCPFALLKRAPCETDADCENAERCEWDGYCDASSSR